MLVVPRWCPPLQKSGAGVFGFLVRDGCAFWLGSLFGPGRFGSLAEGLGWFPGGVKVLIFTSHSP